MNDPNAKFHYAPRPSNSPETIRQNLRARRGDVWRMVAQEGAPVLTGRIISLDHILGDGRLSHGKAELEQLALNARRTPKHVLKAHLPDQSAQLRTDWRSPSPHPRF